MDVLKIKPKEYFAKNPQAFEKLKCIDVQTTVGYDAKFRKLEISDIEFITDGGWNDESGLFAWYYPCGIPHYVKID